MKRYARYVNEVLTYVSLREGLDEINRAMMVDRRTVRTMSSINRTDYSIKYKDGRNVRLLQVSDEHTMTPSGLRIVTVNGNQYAVSDKITNLGRGLRGMTTGRAVAYWNVRNGVEQGFVKYACENSVPDTVDQVLWNEGSK